MGAHAVLFIFTGDQDMPQAELERVCSRALCIQIVQGDPGVTEDRHSHQPTYHGLSHHQRVHHKVILSQLGVTLVFAGDQDMPQTELERVCGRALCIQIVQGDPGVIEDKHGHLPTYRKAEEAGVETSNEHADMAKFETLSLNDSPPTLDSPDGGLAVSTIMVPSAAEEALSPRSEYQRLIEGHPVFDTIEDAFEYLWDNQIGAQALAEAFSQQSSDEFEAQSVVQEEQARSVPAPEQELPIPAPEPVQAHGQYCEASNEEIAQNGKKWMSEEVMVAFRKYVEKHDDLKELEYKFGELHRQCFSVENYPKIFHHFNFTIKMKAPGSTDWTSMLCFAEVKEILTQKIYFCSPLEPYENGHCDACKNQGMDELKHPVVGTFDRGSAGAEFPPKTEECNYLMYEVDPFDYVVPALRKDEADEYDDRWIGKFRWGPAQLM
ncbi:hypothetical protein ACP70R_024866 [Stipagrostis hirtigluma subsp. patula]